MYSAFERLPEEKRHRIIQISIEEFSKTGYENTSTDIITSRAEISKGSLFHYFKSKKNLYLYIFDYCRQLLGDKIITEIETVQSDDFFDRIKQFILVKQKVQYEYLNETKLVTSAMLNPPLVVKEEIEHIQKKHSVEYTNKYLSRIMDRSLLKGNMDREKVMNLTMLALQQVADKYGKLFESGQLNFDQLQERVIPEIDEYIDMIKYGIYK